LHNYVKSAITTRFSTTKKREKMANRSNYYFDSSKANKNMIQKHDTKKKVSLFILDLVLVNLDY
jgi:hypothetical protein